MYPNLTVNSMVYAIEREMLDVRAARIHLAAQAAAQTLSRSRRRGPRRAAGLVGFVAIDRVALAFGRLKRGTTIGSPMASRSTGALRSPRHAAIWRMSALARALGADCPSCRGIGCDTCASTGLA
jgi:hypothetical protein